MSRVPRYGTHDGIKYNPRRTIFRWCIICGEPFFDIKPRSRKKTCSRGCAKLNMLKLVKEHDSKKESTYDREKWNRWYNKLDIADRPYGSKKIRRNSAKRKDTHEEEYDDILKEMKALGLR